MCGGASRIRSANARALPSVIADVSVAVIGRAVGERHRTVVSPRRDVTGAHTVREGHTHTRARGPPTHITGSPLPPLTRTTAVTSAVPRGPRDGGAEGIPVGKKRTRRARRTFSSSPSARLPATSACVRSRALASSAARTPPDDDVARSLRDHRSHPPPTRRPSPVRDCTRQPVVCV